MVGGSFTGINGIGSPYYAGLIGKFDAGAIDSVQIDTLLCAGGSAKVVFKKVKPFNSGNVFTVLLSDSAGSFASPVAIGSKEGEGTGWDTVVATVPTNINIASGYQVKISSSNASASGSSNPFDIAETPTLIAPSSTVVCSDTAHVFQFDSLALSYDSIEWAFDSLFTAPYTAKTGGMSITVPLDSTISVWARAINGHGCKSNTVTTTLQVKTMPSATITPADTVIALGQTVTLTALGGSLYEWESPSASTSSITVTPVLSSVLYSVNITNGLNSCVKTVTAMVTTINTDSILELHTLDFQKNKGQWPAEIKYLTGVGSTNARFLRNGVNFYAARTTQRTVALQNPRLDRILKDSIVEALVWNLEFLGSDTSAAIIDTLAKNTYYNYFRGDSSQFVTDVPVYSQISYRNLYTNIDLRYRTGSSRLEYDVIVKPTADLGDLKMRFSGIKGLTKLSTGELVISTAWGDIVENVPFAYQNIGGTNVPVDVVFEIVDPMTYGFAINGTYDTLRELIIDPLTLQWATYVSGTLLADFGVNCNGMDVDAAGNVYLAGNTYNAALAQGLPLAVGTYYFNANINGAISVMDGFVTKISSDATQQHYVTIFGSTGPMGAHSGGPGADFAMDIKLGGTADDIFVCGHSMYDNFHSTQPFPTVPYTGFPPTFSGGFIIKLNNNGNVLINSRTFDGAFTNAIDVHPLTGNAYIVGDANSGNPLLGFTYPATAFSKAFLAKISFTSSSIVPAVSYSKGLSNTSSFSEWMEDIIIDDAENAYFIGTTMTATDFSTAAFAITPNFTTGNYNGLGITGNENVFIGRVNSTGSSLSTTIIGSNIHEQGRCIGLDNLISPTKAYIAGIANNVGITNPVPYPTFQGFYTPTASTPSYTSTLDIESFFSVVELDETPSFTYSTLLGSNFHATDVGHQHVGFDVSSDGRFYFVATQQFMGDDLPGCVWKNHYEDKDLIMGIIDPSLTGAASLVEATYFGTSLDDWMASGPVLYNDCPIITCNSGKDAFTYPTQGAGEVFGPSLHPGFVGGMHTFKMCESAPISYENKTICAGQCVNLIDLVHTENLTELQRDNLGYEWSENVEDPTSVCPTATTTYQVTVTVHGRCVGQGSIVITVLGGQVAIVEGAEECNATLTAVNGGAYLWSTGATTSAITAYESGTYSVTATYVVSTVTCTSSASVTVSTESCCPSDRRFSGNYTSSYVCSQLGVTPNSAGVSIVMLPSSSISFAGTMTVDNNLLFFNCHDIIMEKDAKILVGNGATLNLLNSHVYGCEFLWKGIELASGSTPGEVGVFNSEINDALYAVWLKEGSRFRSTNSTYEDNFVGIYFDESSSSNPSPGFTSLAPLFGNRFIGTRNLLPASPNLASTPPFQPALSTTNWGWSGIHGVKLSNLSVGSQGQAVNVFSTLANGIVVDACNLTVSNSMFFQANDHGYSYTYPAANGLGIEMHGNAILATNFKKSKHSPTGEPLPSHLVVVGLGKSSFLPAFLNCDRGITADKMNVAVSECYMSSPPATSQSGIKIQNSWGAGIYLYNNKVTHAERGIQLLFDDPGLATWVHGNEINIATQSPFPNGVGLEVQGRKLSNGTLNEYSGNEVNTNLNAFSGVSFATMSEFNFLKNRIHFNQPANNTFGVSYSSNLNFTDSNNYVNGAIPGTTVPNRSGNFPVGVYYNVNDGGRHLCNTIEDVYTGVMFVGQNPNLNFAGNKFNTLPVPGGVTARMNTGLLIDNSVTANLQPNRGNEWYGANGSYPFSTSDGTYLGYWIENRTQPVLQMRFRTSQFFTGHPLRPWNGDQFPSNGQHYYYGGVSEYTCSDSPLCPTCLVFNETDSVTAYGGQEFDVYPSQQQWMAEEALFEKLMANPQILDSNGLADSFYTAKAASAMAQFARIDSIIRKAAVLDSASLAASKAKFEGLDSLFKRQIVLDSLLGDSTETDTVLYRSEYLNIISEVDSLELAADTGLSAYYIRRDSMFRYALALNAGISTGTAIESFRKAINAVSLKYTIANDSMVLDSNTKKYLYSIAFQCPLYGGKAVFMARSLLSLLVDTVYHDDTLCMSGYMAKKETEETGFVRSKEKSVRMFPNPASEYVNLSYSGVETQTLRLCITDVTGRKVMDEEFSSGSGSHRINTVDFASGFYFVNLYEGSESIFAQKLSIVSK